MEGKLRPGPQRPGDFTTEALNAIRALDALGHDPILIACHPWDAVNPYQPLLYQRAWESGTAVVPMLELDNLEELSSLARSGLRTLLHLHWLNRILAGSSSADEAETARTAFVRRLDGYLASGGALAWTVHNVLPHRARFENVEARLSSDVVERATVVHTLATNTPSVVSPWFEIPPEKVLNVPHPAYTGAYEDYLAPAQARQMLSLMPDERVHLVLGGIRAYKGLARLLDAWDALADDGVPRRLVIAGRPSDEPSVGDVLERAALHPTILLHAALFEPSAVQVYMRAADVAVHPHVRALNSGSLMLAVTFGKRCVVPVGGGLDELIDERFARPFREDDPDHLVSALREAEGLDAAGAAEATQELVTSRAPALLAEQFATRLRASLAPAEAAPGPGLQSGR